MCNKHHTIHLCPSPSIHLEHTELLADVGKTVRLLDLVLNDVESHRLGQGSSSYVWREELPALTNGHDITLLHLKAGRAVSGDVAMSLLVTTPSRSQHTSTVCTS